MSAKIEFKKNNLDFYLDALAKEYKKINKGKICIELILVGGAAVVANYEFRDMTTDMDAIIDKTFGLKEAIYKVSQNYNLPEKWINNDFMKTSSYSVKLRQFSKHYKTFCHCIEVRTINAEYLIAMKMMAAREYKKDLSDIVGILKEQEENNKPISREKIEKAFFELYGKESRIDNRINCLLNELFKENALDEMYIKIRKEEEENKELIKKLDEKYPEILKKNKISDVIAIAKLKK